MIQKINIKIYFIGVTLKDIDFILYYLDQSKDTYEDIEAPTFFLSSQPTEEESMFEC